MTEKPARVRFAPSPTGYLHIGSARSALFNWLYARHTGGQFIVRIEDTDRKRYVEDALDDFLTQLRWLGLDWDEGPEVGGDYGPYFQSQRLDLYRKWADWLVDNGFAYRCYCTPERLQAVREEQRQRKEKTGYDRHCRYLTGQQRAQYEAEGRSYVIRLAVPLEGTTTFQDAIRGEISFNHAEFQDTVLLKSDGWPTYHLAAVVDDHLMDITHIMRSDEWLNSVPIGVLLYQAFGWQPPVWAHLPVILNPNGKGKMSKRQVIGKDGTVVPVHMRDYQAAGYLPDAMFNFLAHVGWSLDDSTEVFSREEAIDAFAIDGIKPSPAAFPADKLAWIDGVYIRERDDDDLYLELLPFVAQGLDMSEQEVDSRPELRQAVPLIKERMRTLVEAAPMVAFLFEDGEPDYPDPQLLVPKKTSRSETIDILEKTSASLAALPEFDSDSVEAALRELPGELELKPRQVFSAIRVAVTGTNVSPPLFESITILGRERTLLRLAAAKQAVTALTEDG